MTVHVRCVCAALLALLVGACGDVAPRARPNIVLIVIDTLRQDHLSLHGYERATSPRIERWAANGTVYEHAHAPAPWTVPSMTMLLSGQQVLRRFAFTDPARVPLAEHLQHHGYQTAAFVANSLLTEEKGWDRGFDTYDQDEHARGWVGGDGWPAAEVVRKGLKWVQARDQRPFFLLLHLFDPHFPYDPEGGSRFEPFDRAEHKAALRAALPEERKDLLTDSIYREIERAIAAYDSEIQCADEALGMLFDALETEGLRESTLVVLTADHGEGLWQRATPKTVRENLRGYFPDLFYSHGKMVYEEQVRVPLVMCGPGVPSGLRSRARASLLDVTPTLLSLADLPALPELDGRALDPRENGGPVERFTYFTHCCALTLDGRWKLHVGYGRKGETEIFPPELYDLEQDPLELHPIDDRMRIAAMQARIDEWLLAHEDSMVPLGEKERAAMQALGYLGDEQALPASDDPNTTNNGGDLR